MNLKFTKDERKFLGKWVLTNSIAWPIGIIVAIVLSYGIVNQFYHKETNLIVGLCLGAVVASSQWLVIRRYFKIGIWWIFAAGLGIGLPFILEVLISELSGNEIGMTGIEIIDQAMLLFIGGVITGLLQFNIFKSLASKFKWWIIISAFAWGIGWFGLFFGGLILGLTTGIAILRLFELPVQVNTDKGV